MACGSCGKRRAQQQKIKYEATFSNGEKVEFDTYAQAKSEVRRRGGGQVRTKSA